MKKFINANLFCLTQHIHQCQSLLLDPAYSSMPIPFAWPSIFINANPFCLTQHIHQCQSLLLDPAYSSMPISFAWPSIFINANPFCLTQHIHQCQSLLLDPAYSSMPISFAWPSIFINANLFCLTQHIHQCQSLLLDPAYSSMPISFAWPSIFINANLFCLTQHIHQCQSLLLDPAYSSMPISFAWPSIFINASLFCLTQHMPISFALLWTFQIFSTTSHDIFGMFGMSVLGNSFQFLTLLLYQCPYLSLVCTHHSHLTLAILCCWFLHAELPLCNLLEFRKVLRAVSLRLLPVTWSQNSKIMHENYPNVHWSASGMDVASKCSGRSRIF